MIDYKALVADRKQKQTRPIVRYPICLKPELYADLEEAAGVVDSLVEQDRRSAAAKDLRQGGLSPAEAAINAARDEVQKVEAEIAEVTIVGVFKAPTADRQGAQSDELQKRIEADAESANAITVEDAKARILESFERFEAANRVPIPTLSREDLADLVGAWAQGEVMGLSRKIASASTREQDLPFSVRQSLAARRSAETSK